MKNLIRYIVFVLMLGTIFSCATQENANDVLKDLAASYMGKESLSYNAYFEQKFFNASDTVNIKGHCNIVRVLKDTLFGGYIDLTTNDGMERIYDLSGIYVADSVTKTTMFYDPKKNEDFAIKGNFTVSIINDFFLHPESIVELAESTKHIKHFSTDSNGNKNIVIEYPDEGEFKNIVLKMTLNDETDHILSMEHVTTFQGNKEYKKWTFTEQDFNALTPDFYNSRRKNLVAKFKYQKYEAPEESQYALLPVNSVAPNFSGIDFGSGKKTTLKDLKGKIVILDFFYMSCMPCVRAIPHLSAVQEKFKDRGVVVLGINSKDNNDKSKNNFSSFIKRNDFKYTVLFTGNEVDRLYNVNVYPTLYVIGKDGKVLGGQLGSSDDLEKGLLDFLETVLD